MRKVLQASTHQTIHDKEVGEIGRVFDSTTKIQGSKSFDVSMLTDGTALYLKVTRNGKSVELLIPSANVVVMSLAPESL